MRTIEVLKRELKLNPKSTRRTIMETIEDMVTIHMDDVDSLAKKLERLGVLEELLDRLEVES